MINQPDIQYAPYQKTALDLIHLYENGNLNLEPGFQRQSVWTNKDREKLIDSIVRGYPLPAIFLYKRYYEGEVIYDVIDGKQRIETILMFTGNLRGNRFDAKVLLPGEEESYYVDWNYLKRKKLQNIITGFQFSVIEVTGNSGNIIDLFVRINSTGKALSKAEKQHAKYYNSPFLKEAGKLAARYEVLFIHKGILSATAISRMKHVELISEIMLSVLQNDVLNKKAALDRIMEKDNISARDLKKARERTVKAINRVKIIFPKLKETRFKKISDYYVLVVLFSKFEMDGLILTDKKRNKLAWDILREFALGVDAISEKRKKFETLKENDEMFRNYWTTVQAASDEISNRRKRFEILDGLLRSLFEYKDIQRLFSVEQRRLLWHSTDQKKCRVCKKTLSWSDFTIDHIDPHSKGGKSRLENAALMCRKHNSSKGNRS